MDAFGIENHGYSPLISQKYVVKGDFEVYDGMDLLHHAMLNTLPNINKDGGKDEHGKTIRIPDFEARQKADTLITEIRQAFVEWLHAQPDDFKERLTDLYNRKFNCYVRPRYDGSHQQFPGLDLRGLGIEDLYPSQKDAIWMIKQNGGGICDHEVGTGKTLIMCVAAYEMHRLGLARKPMIIGIKANIHESLSSMSSSIREMPRTFPKKVLTGLGISSSFRSTNPSTGLSQCPSALSRQGGLHAGEPPADLQRHQEQQLGLHHPYARTVRQDTPVGRGAAADSPAGDGRHR